MIWSCNVYWFLDGGISGERSLCQINNETLPTRGINTRFPWHSPALFPEEIVDTLALLLVPLLVKEKGVRTIIWCFFIPLTYLIIFLFHLSWITPIYGLFFTSRMERPWRHHCDNKYTITTAFSMIFCTVCVQDDHSACSQGCVDIKTTVAF